ncbi:GNAT family N-acetyltransferase [Actinoplanes sp. NPDC089786]|uniref:GNAT family N-acetyltransferase n=1 Tax=Actinoplanes sp. NPDC089786 TaxID=3155185 RepID=UPI003449F91B
MDSEFWIAELTDDDVPAVVSLCRAALDLPEDAAEAAEIVHRLRGTGGPATRRTAGFLALAPAEEKAWSEGAGEEVAATSNRVIGVVLGSVSHRDPSIGHIDLIAVDRRERRRGVARALVSRVEGALAGLGASDVVIAGNPPVYAWPGIDVRYTPAICAAMALGFEEDQPAWNMTADLETLGDTEADEARLAGRGVVVRGATPADGPALTDLAESNFGRQWAAEITDSTGCHVAVRDGSILGFAAYGSRPNWFGPMGTAPAAQGLGIGSVLLKRCLADQKKAGLTSVQIGWVGPMPFYSQVVGARVERVFFLYRKQL